jgi:hypothetical protein
MLPSNPRRSSLITFTFSHQCSYIVCDIMQYSDFCDSHKCFCNAIFRLWFVNGCVSKEQNWISLVIFYLNTVSVKL